jgi:hypothetical protein
MTCKDAINSDTNSDDKKWYLLNENTSYNKIFEFNLEGTTDQTRLLPLMWTCVIFRMSFCRITIVT